MSLNPFTRLLQPEDLDGVRVLAEHARREGFQFVDRLVTRMQSDRPLTTGDEWFVGVVVGDELVGVGGVTPDPYSDDATVGRVRHVYIRPSNRRAGAASMLLRELEKQAQPRYAQLRLRTETKDAARFYEALGYQPIKDPHATHIKRASALASPDSARKAGPPHR